MFQARIKSAFFVEGLIKHMNSQGFPSFLEKKGFEDCGIFYVKVMLPENKARLFSRRENFETNKLEWFSPLHEMQETLDYNEINAYTNRMKERDRDCWIIEIEDPKDKLGTPNKSDYWLIL